MKVLHCVVIFFGYFLFVTASSIIIIEDAKACFRRAIAGKRVVRGFVQRSLFCERLEDCQQECGDEKRFMCEGFNYKLDPSGRGKGECELLEVPFLYLDVGRDLIPDPNYDYYERDRNAGSNDCKGYRPPGGGGGYGPDPSYYRPPLYEIVRKPPSYGNRWNPPPPPPPDRRYDYDYNSGGPPSYGSGAYRPSYDNRRGDYSYHHSHHSQEEYDSSHEFHFNAHFDDRIDAPPYDLGPPRKPYLPSKPSPTPASPSYDLKPYEPHYSYPKPKPINNVGYGSENKYHDHWKPNDYNWNRYGGNYGTSSKDDFGPYYYKPPSHNQNRLDYDKPTIYLPDRVGGSYDWGQYGGSYGNGGFTLEYDGYKQNQGYDYWGLSHKKPSKNPEGPYYYERPKPKPSYLPIPTNPEYLPELPKPIYISPQPKPEYLPELPKPIYIPPQPKPEYLPEPPRPIYIPSQPKPGYLPSPPKPEYLPLPPKSSLEIYLTRPDHTFHSFRDNSILPAEPRLPGYNYFKDECSLRSAAGFKLHKGIVKKLFAVPSVFECEVLCFREADFPCSSYAYRYTITSRVPSDNCYLSNRSYKELDYYTDVEPDRDFDIYTMNNQNSCKQPVLTEKDNSDCFWRVRSGQRLDNGIVRDSLMVESIVECQLECLRSKRFTCRAFSFRYGSGILGGSIDNCQLTDWPYYELNPQVNFIPEPGFEIYERGSYGHGCEPYHFAVRGRSQSKPALQVDQLCYIGFGSPSMLLPQATRKSLSVPTELQCKAECSKLREGTLFQCMSFSYRTETNPGMDNCYLSDILQRDLLKNVDYVPDPNSWLFAWDNYNPECIALANKPIHSNGDSQTAEDNKLGRGLGIKDTYYGLDTWRSYSVSGWPCRRGSLCKENRAGGFWYCELDGGDEKSWDYCCRPDHQCGYSERFPYQWCYVGIGTTQWRKCSDRYYPYVHNLIDRIDIPPYNQKPPYPSYGTSGTDSSFSYDIHLEPPPSIFRPGARPDRPPSPPSQRPPMQSLDEYEAQFDNEFLAPPKPGGFGQPRHWPVSYLHKEMPANMTKQETSQMKMQDNPRLNAIESLINVIKSNDFQNIQYQITNQSNSMDDILLVQIPLPMNISNSIQKGKMQPENKPKFQAIDLSDSLSLKNSSRVDKSLPSDSDIQDIFSVKRSTNNTSKLVPVYRKGYVTRTNVTSHGSRNRRLLNPNN